MGLKVYTIQKDINNGEINILPTDDEIYNNRIIAINDTLTSMQVERLWKLIRNLQECC